MGGASITPCKATPVPYWNGTCVRSRFFDAISLLLPAAESFINDTLQHWLEESGGQLITPHMRCEVERFMREEQRHLQVHQRYNAALAGQNAAAADLLDWAHHAVESLRALDLPVRMALVAGCEQITAVLSREMLAHGYLLSAAQTPQSRMWRWHAREEVSHSHVAVAAAASLQMGRWKRLVINLGATLMLGRDILFLWRRLCRGDVAMGTVGRWQMRLQFCEFLLRGVPAFARMGVDWVREFLPLRRRRGTRLAASGC